IGGEAWVEAAKAIAQETGVAVNTVVVGPGRDYSDLYGLWTEAREVKDSGCLLVRPDYHIAFRAQETAGDAENQLRNAFKQILGK
ncbi:MAG TPA: 2,4-dichlorophenol 6-monooxygenase, partial [Cytophagales bacterium]|nr:2,4-dichlorophenol 6-monooxygenase [Cytophagales bacterium]